MQGIRKTSKKQMFIYSRANSRLGQIFAFARLQKPTPVNYAIGYIISVEQLIYFHGILSKVKKTRLFENKIN